MDELNQQLVSLLRRLDAAVSTEPSEIVIGDVELPLKKIDLPAHLGQFKPVMYCPNQEKIPTALKPLLNIKWFPDKHFFLILPRRTASYIDQMKLLSEPGREVKDFIFSVCVVEVWQKAQLVQLKQAGSGKDYLHLTSVEISNSLQGILDLESEASEDIEQALNTGTISVLQRGGALMMNAARGDLMTATWLAHRAAEAELLATLVTYCGTEDNVFTFLRRCREKLIEKVN